MATQNQVARRAIQIRDGFTYQAATGLTISALTVVLQRESADTLVSATETVSLAEIGSGLYWLEFTPEHAARYRFTVVPAVADTYVITPDEEQIEVVAYGSAGGPYLTTLAEVKAHLNIGTSSNDDLLNALIVDVTSLCEAYVNRSLMYSASITETYNGRNADYLVLRRMPVVSITSVHVSTDLPRVYGSDELLTAGEDYIVDENPGTLWKAAGTWPAGPKTVQVVYAAGWQTVPDYVERTAIEIIQTKWKKGINQEYHLHSISGNEGTISGILFDDIPKAAREVLDSLRDCY